MRDVIDNTIASHVAKGSKWEAVKQHIEKKYRISIDVASLKHRARLLKLNY